MPFAFPSESVFAFVGILTLVALVVFVSLNDNFIALKNGMKLQGETTLEQVFRAAVLATSVAGVLLGACEAFAFNAVRHSRLVSTRGRHRQIARLRIERRKLRRRFAIVDN
jgi:hypothetical protein